MNCHERKAFKRKKASLENWKNKAKSRRYELKKAKLKIRDLSKSRDMWKERAIRNQSKSREIVPISAKAHPTEIDPEAVKFIMICFCVNLVINYSVSFSSVPKILNLVKDLLERTGRSLQFMIPHFTTVINWTLRMGKHPLKSALVPCRSHWICIIDHTRQIGSKKEFAVLKILPKAVRAQGALTLKDVEVIHIQVQEKSSGEIIENILKRIFRTTGYPRQIVTDRGSDLKKGVRLIVRKMKNPFTVTYDLTHFIASLLRKKYATSSRFKELRSLMSYSRKKIMQTSLAHLIPAKERHKSRFLNLPSWAGWFEKMLNFLRFIPSDGRRRSSSEKKISEHLGWIRDQIDFLEPFLSETRALSSLQFLLKNTSLNEFSYKKSLKIILNMDDANLRVPLREHLDYAFRETRSVGGALLLFSDVIESLFGKYKFMAKPNAFSEINRSILLLPAICANITPELVREAFARTGHKELIDFHKDIGPSVLSKRRAAFKNDQNKAPAKIISFSKSNDEYDFERAC